MMVSSCKRITSVLQSQTYWTSLLLRLTRLCFNPPPHTCTALVLTWGKSMWSTKDKMITHPGLIHRQVMAQSQVLEDHPLHPSGVINIVPETCRGDQVGPSALPEGKAVMPSTARCDIWTCFVRSRSAVLPPAFSPYSVLLSSSSQNVCSQGL